jgi:S1-C subfamily serine protease
MPFVASMIKHGKVLRADLGCDLLRLPKGTAEKYGMYGWMVDAVQKGSPAEKAGLQAGDLLKEMGGRSIMDIGELQNALALLPAGEELDLTYQRPSSKLIEAVRAGKEPGLASWNLLEGLQKTKITLNPVSK